MNASVERLHDRLVDLSVRRFGANIEAMTAGALAALLATADTSAWSLPRVL
jgi:hypothetical protein